MHTLTLKANMASRDSSSRSSSKAGELINAFDDQDPVGWMFFTRFNIIALRKYYLSVLDMGIPEGEKEAEREERLERFDRINGKLCQLKNVCDPQVFNSS